MARHVRECLREALTNPRFVCDCLERALAAMDGPPGSVWTGPPVHDDESGQLGRLTGNLTRAGRDR